MNRRSFIKSSLAAAAVGGPLIVPSRVLGLDGAVAPSNRINIGVIGAGGIAGGFHFPALLRNANARITAVCDVDARRLNTARDGVSGYYANSLPAGTPGDCAGFQDFRELLALPDLDAVLIATPDHWHAVIAIAAMKAGKDVYGEKPMTLTIAEGQAMVNATRRYGRVFQTGTQNRSNHVVRGICELVRNGVLGKVHTVQVGLPASIQLPRQPVMPVPPEFDYDLWLGPAPFMPYTEQRCHFSFRGILDYSGGSLTDLGTHYFNVMHWAMGVDHSGPVSIEGHGNFDRNHLSDVANTYQYDLEYAEGFKVTGGTSLPLGVRFEGENGWIFLPLGFPGPETNPTVQTPSASDPALLATRLDDRATRLFVSNDHHDTFLRAVRTRGESASPVEIGHRSTSVCHLINISMRLGRKLRWNPITEEFIGDDSANQMRSRAMREPWSLT
jgi:predicted dehydrogenase